MAIRNIGMHHLHVRKRIHQKHEHYPHPNKYKQTLDKIMYFIGLVGPLTLMPQIIKIYSTQDASSIALSMRILLFCLSIFWVLYSIAHKELILLVANLGWIIGYIFIIIGAIIY